MSRNTAKHKIRAHNVLLVDIPNFEGLKPITELQHYPLIFFKDAEETKRRLLERGKKVLDYQGLTYCTYNGIGIYREDKRVEKHNVSATVSSLAPTPCTTTDPCRLGRREGSD
jgi:hypothetical protein